MSKSPYVKIQFPKELVDAAYEAIQIANKTGSVRKGTNETTKAIERVTAKLVIIAENVDPPEVVAHLPLLCEEKHLPYLYVPDKQKLGEAVGIGIPSASVTIVKEGDAGGLIKEIIQRIQELKNGKK